MTDPIPGLTQSVRGSWRGFLDVYEPLRPELYRYCRHLTGSPWDAEDLAQEALARAFATLARLIEPPPHPRAWLFRVASNLWVDQLRRRRDTPGAVPESATSPEARAPREAMGTLVTRLSPQERAAVVLKDVFDLTLEEISEALSTTVGAIKAALHRGRTKLVDTSELKEGLMVAPGKLDAFCEAFNARDIDRLAAMLLDSATIEVVGASTGYGREVARKRVLPGMLFGSRVLADLTLSCGVELRYRHGALPTPPRAEVRLHRGEPLLLSWYAHDDGEAVRAVTRLTFDDSGLVSHLHNYFYTPEVIAEVCRELGVPFRVNGYFSSEACGSSGRCADPDPET
ncbi:ECF family RNA polymerase sigma factor [Myxococcus stipitatus DSM 14675]|uniref:RNA polymerase sigma factor n=1 Tax=Myxococcus stipitatus (strain DSM 14675 / JCM 12634 / Mx s8) TaxID=1278073 RepID=L7U6R0_MYXSD|nr:RNA polymerase sigma factor [Myxococcus stipitatus]AGC43798.1 ECF family RNA polymerase sigma factor [Myxococcus stipitatus DSM 14675]